MAKIKVSIPLDAPTQDIAVDKAKELVKIGEVLTLDNLRFLSSLASKPGINQKLSGKMIRTLIKTKL